MRSADAQLRDAVRRNDSSLISNESLNLLTTTLSNWGNMVKNLGTRADSDDDDDDTADNSNESAKPNQSITNGSESSSKKTSKSEKSGSKGVDDSIKSEADAEQFLLSKEQEEQEGQGAAGAAAITLPGGQQQVSCRWSGPSQSSRHRYSCICCIS